MFVYMIQFGEIGPVKIGWTTGAVEARLKHIQLWCPEDLHIIRTIPAARRLEPMLHFYFRDQHIRGEWFRFSAEMMTVTTEEVMLVGNGGRDVPVVFSRWKVGQMTRTITGSHCGPPIRQQFSGTSTESAAK